MMPTWDQIDRALAQQGGRCVCGGELTKLGIKVYTLRDDKIIIRCVGCMAARRAKRAALRTRAAA